MKRLCVLLLLITFPCFMMAGGAFSGTGYDSSGYNTLERKVLPLNIKVIAGEKKNVLNNALFGWRVDKNDNIIKDGKSNVGYENTIFIVEYDYDLNNSGTGGRPAIHIPNGSILVFQGGSFKNGTIDFPGSSFDVVGKYNIFHDTKVIDPSVSIVYPEWFYEDSRHHLEIALQRINDNYRNSVRHTNGVLSTNTELIVAIDGNYMISKTVNLNKPFKLIGNASNYLTIDSQVSSILIPDNLKPAINIIGNSYFECNGVQFCGVKGLNYYSSEGVSNILFSIKTAGNTTVKIENCSFRGIHQVINASPKDEGQKEIWIGADWDISNNDFLLCHDGIVIQNVNKGLKYTVANMDISKNTFDCSNYAINIKGAFGILDIHHNTFESVSGICRSFIEGANVPCYVLYRYNYIEHHKGGEKKYLLEVNNAQLVDIRTNLIMSSRYVFDVSLTKVKKYYDVDNGDFLKVVKK